MEYRFREIEGQCRKWWQERNTYRVEETVGKEPYYVLDMFPYPSGAGLHVGHPLGYIASDIVARYQRLKGCNVLHPMGFDAFGLPAEQYAIQTGCHPSETTEQNIQTYKNQLDQLGFSFDWERSIRTCDPEYYKWTQWIFLKLYNAWFNRKTNKSEPIDNLIATFSSDGNGNVDACCDEVAIFSAASWNAMPENEKQKILLSYRLAFLSESWVNWCPSLGTVLANDEVKDGVSERGGYPVERKKMKQWSLRINAYAQRLLDGLEQLDWTNAMKEMQRNWIGRSEGAYLSFEVENAHEKIDVFTTRPDTIFGVTFMVLAPEHPLVGKICTKEKETTVEAYAKASLMRSERDRMADTKTVTGCYTGTDAIHPLTKERIPIWIADYVLIGYGTGAIMAVPAGDERDWRFAKKYGLKIKPIFEGHDCSESACEHKSAHLINSDFLDGKDVVEAIPLMIRQIETMGIGYRHLNYRIRNAVFGRQRYWGEPIPIYYKDGIPYPLPEKKLPLILPEIDKYLPTEKGDPPLARASDWHYRDEDGNSYPYEQTTMPGWAGSSWYYLRYMDPGNDSAFAGAEKVKYWGNVDLYVGGAEHATGHLLYVRFWTKVLFDLGYLPFDEPAQKLINQGMIGGRIEYIFLMKEKLDGNPHFICSELAKERGLDDLARIPVPITMVHDYDGDSSYMNSDDIAAFISWQPEYANAVFECSRGTFHKGTFSPASDAASNKLITHTEVGKMSKRYHNTIDPLDIVNQYGADTLRLYEMFLGPLEDHKPWNTQGIEGTHRFLKKFWRLFFTDDTLNVVEGDANDAALKVLHRTIKRITEDLQRFSFNTVVSEMMKCVNDLSALKCNNRQVLEPLVIAFSPYIPHICEALWHELGHSDGVCNQAFPQYEEKYLSEDTIQYPVQINGKKRFVVDVPAGFGQKETEKAVLKDEKAQKWMEGRSPRKVIVVPGRIINIVL